MARGLVLWSALLCCAPLSAQQTAFDPTRPPNVIQAPEAAVPSGPVLQVIRTVAGVRTAVISGQEVKVGSHFADQRVLRIDEDQVVLSGSPAPQVLKLFPGVAKTSRTAEPEPAKRRGEKAKRKDAP